MQKASKLGSLNLPLLLQPLPPPPLLPLPSRQTI
jgi:hypothetical protein